MAEKDIIIAGATFNSVPSIDIPTSGGGSASFVEVSDTTAIAADVAQGKYFYTAAGVKTAGTASGAVVQPLSVTQNGTYNPPSGVDGYAPVTVNVSGGGGNIVYVPYDPEYEQGAVSGQSVTYSSNKTSSTTRIRPVDIVDVSQFLNDTVLFVWDESQYDITIQQYDVNGIARVYGNPWYTKAVVTTISQPNIVIPIKKKSVANITPSEFASVNLKLVSLTDSVF